MFSFWPQLLIIVSLAGIIVVLLRKIPTDKTTRLRLIRASVLQFLKKAGKELWHFVLEVKGISKNPMFRGQNLVAKFKKANIHFPRPKLPFFKSESSLDDYISQAQLDIDREDFGEAERKLIKAIEKDPKNESAYSTLGKLYLNIKRFEESIETYNFLLKHYPDNDLYWSNLGQAYHGYKLYDKAIEAYEHAIELDPKAPKRYVNLGLTLEARKHIEEAILNYRKALQLEATNLHFMLVLAEALAKKGEKEEAELLLEQILQAEPTNHLARERLMQLKF